MGAILKRIQDFVDDILEYVGRYYVYSIITLHILYVFALIGFLSFTSETLRVFNVLIQVFICLFLIFRFHPFRKHELREYDGKIIFGSAAFLLFNLGVIEIFTSLGTNLLTNTIKPMN